MNTDKHWKLDDKFSNLKCLTWNSVLMNYLNCSTRASGANFQYLRIIRKMIDELMMMTSINKPFNCWEKKNQIDVFLIFDVMNSKNSMISIPFNSWNYIKIKNHFHYFLPHDNNFLFHWIFETFCDYYIFQWIFSLSLSLYTSLNSKFHEHVITSLQIFDKGIHNYRQKCAHVMETHKSFDEMHLHGSLV